MSDSSMAGVALPVWRNRSAWAATADVIAVLVVLVLPWSTSLVAIFVAAWLVAVTPTLDMRAFVQSLKRPVCALPIAFVMLAVVGTLWSDAPWSARLYAINPTVKLLVLPVLLYHFERSVRGAWIGVAFLVSCTLLMIMSWVVAFDPHLALKSNPDFGIPVKNYIDQSQEFALCTVALAYPFLALLRRKKFWLAGLPAAIALAFIVNMTFVTVSRTALVTIPIMIGLFALLHLRWQSVIVTVCTMTVLVGAAWYVSPLLKAKTSSFFSQYSQYEHSHEATSIGLRLEFWRKSLGFFVEAPLIGHGTGSTKGLFQQVAVGQVGAAAEVIGNPHNQTLNVAVQWGAVGVVVLYAMWLQHLLLFRSDGLAAWIGLLVVVQNAMSSLFNSHLFDFHEGWMYVLGVGVAGGMVLGSKARSSGPSSASGSLTPADGHRIST
jgi:O-antigen ligase